MDQYNAAIENGMLPNYFEYTVNPGDSLWKIALKFGTTVEKIKIMNNLTNNVLMIDQVLKIPVTTARSAHLFEYTVEPADTLWLIAQKFNTTISDIKAHNNLTSDVLFVGQKLKIPQYEETMVPTHFNYTVVSGDSLWKIAQKFGTTVNSIIMLNELNNTMLRIGQMLKIPNKNAIKTIVVDAGHGGNDPGAVNGERFEKNDNLNLALAVQKKLQARGQNVIMTRTTDVFIPLEERSAISNQSNADLFISLHRNSNENPMYNGIDNFVYLMAPQKTANYAQNVIDEVESVGVQNNRGVNRENFAVLRNTAAPSMLLEMGFISNEEDNRLFDQNFEAYAEAIARGILKSLNI